MQSPVIHWGTGCYCSLAVVSELAPANTVLAVHCNATLGDFTKRDGCAYLYLVYYTVVNACFTVGLHFLYVQLFSLCVCVCEGERKRSST